MLQTDQQTVDCNNPPAYIAITVATFGWTNCHTNYIYLWW